MLWLISAPAKELYPQLSLAAGIALTAPVQTADVERLFSALKLVSKYEKGCILTDLVQGQYIT